MLRWIFDRVRDWRRGYSDRDIAEAARIYNAADKPDFFTKMTPRQQRACKDAFWGF